jgi:hypothetical protein
MDRKLDISDPREIERALDEIERTVSGQLSEILARLFVLSGSQPKRKPRVVDFKSPYGPRIRMKV